MTLAEGELVDGKYRVLRKIGEGGMGAVFEAENIRISRRVAIKTLNAAAAARSDMIERFEREAQAAGRIGNDHILEVLDLGSLPDGDRFIVMEFLEGQNLGDRIKERGAMDPRALATLIAQVCDGLQAAHDAGIIHRDLKPDNIFLVREKAGIADYVKIIDFGISKFQQLGGDMSMTRTGTLMGTPYYMSPEQARGTRGADHRTDIYALGVIMFEALVGEVPFSGETFNELMFNIVLAEPPSLQAKLPNLDPNLSRIVAQAMDREAALRFDSAKALGEALTAWLMGGRSGTAVIPHLNLQSGTAVMAPLAQVASSPTRAQQPPAPSGNAGGLTQPITAASAGGLPGAATTAGVSLSDDPIEGPKRTLLAPLLVGGFALLLLAGGGAGVLVLSQIRNAEATDMTELLDAGSDAALQPDAAAKDAGSKIALTAARDGGGDASLPDLVDAAPDAPAVTDSTTPDKPPGTPGKVPAAPVSPGKPTPASKPGPTSQKPNPGGGFDFGY